MGLKDDMQGIKNTLNAVAAALPLDYMEAIGATNLQVCSPRSVRFDLSPGKEGKDGVNRIKITLEPSGDLMLRTYRVEEVEALPNITPSFLQTAIKNIAGIEPAAK